MTVEDTPTPETQRPTRRRRPVPQDPPKPERRIKIHLGHPDGRSVDVEGPMDHASALCDSALRSWDMLQRINDDRRVEEAQALIDKIKSARKGE